MTNFAPTTGLDRLRRPSGNFAMLALDQRESLRVMFPLDASGQHVSDDVLRSFKRTALGILTPYASGVLVDRLFAIGDTRPAEVDPECGIIVAVDTLLHDETRMLADTAFDRAVSADFLREVGAHAVKALVLWRADSGREERSEIVRCTQELAREAGVATLIEGIVRPPEGRGWADQAERHEAVFAAAEELSAFEPDVYKAEVPGYLTGDTSRVEEHSRRMSEIVGGEWVVLSNGVRAEDFLEAVRAARRGGAAGFLAGRAVWADVPGEADEAAALRERSVARLLQLGEVVDDPDSAVAALTQNEGAR